METSPANQTYPTLDLADDDRALLQRAAFAKFDLPSLIIGDGHPAQRTLCTLIAWFDQPHIRAASDAIVAAITRAETYARELRQSELHKSIETLLAAALSLVNTQQSLDPAHNASAPLPDSPAAKSAATAASRALAVIREGRQLANAAIKAGLQAVAPKSSRATRNNNSTHDDANAANQLGSSQNNHALSELQSALQRAQSAAGERVLLAS